MTSSLVFIMYEVVTFAVLVVTVGQTQGGRTDQAWYVSLDGGPDKDCGYSLVYPCRSLAYVLGRASKDDTILIDGAPTRHGSVIYEICDTTGTVFNHVGISGSLSLRGYNGAPKIGCSWEPSAKRGLTKRDTGANMTLTMSGQYEAGNLTYTVVDDESNDVTPTPNISTTNATTDFLTTYQPSLPDTTPPIENTNNSNCKVLLQDLELVNGMVIYGNCSIEIRNVVFENATIRTPDGCGHVNVTMEQSSFFGLHMCEGVQCKDQQISNITCQHVNIQLNKCRFYQTSFSVNGKRVTNMSVSNSLFSNDPNQIQYLGGLHLTFSAQSADIYITNSTFEKQMHPSRVQSVINLYQASLWLKATKEHGDNTAFTNARVNITDCVFQDNERGITMVGPFAQISLERTTFLRNTAMHAGAAILILIHGANALEILNCTFQDNVAGKFRNDYPLKESIEEFSILGSEVHLNTECCKGVVELVGKGGAVRVQRGKTMLMHSRFINNTARLLGGSVFVDIDGNLNVQSTYFENTPSHDHALQGDILYSDGLLFVNEVELVARSALNGLSIFRHSGDHWTLDITNVWIECPVGYDLRATNSSAYGVANEGLRRSYKLDQLSYYCESCPRNKYSLDHGYLNYTTIIPEGETRGFAYFSLLINGSEPTPKHTDKYIHHKVECKDCPYGGHCVQGISSVANFWGYEQNESAKFQHCPRGYCCSTHVCPSINPCNLNRRGRLCGRCIEGYAEALFSPNCIPNDQCGVLWLYPFSIAVGLVYAVFLLFQADLQAFLFSKPLGFSSLFKKLCQRKKRPFTNGTIKSTLKSNSPLEDAQFIPNGGADYSDIHNGHLDMSSSHSLKTRLQNETTENECNREKSAFNDKGFGSGFLVIMFYYFQDALLLNVDTVFIKEESKGQKLMKSILSGIFKFQLDLFELLEGVCAYENMTAVPNNLAKALIVPYVIALFVVMYILYKVTTLCRVQTPTTSRPFSGDSYDQPTRARKSFATRLASGFILALLFMFQKLGTTTFILLNCVPIDKDMVLFIDGEVQCYQQWQYAVMAYATVCVSPFFLVLLFGPCMLQRGKISLPEFFLASLCPLPFLLFWFGSSFWRRKETHNNRPKRLPNSVSAVLVILQGPFKENSLGLCWSGVLIGRRLVLILLFTFVTDSLIRLLLMLLACFVILLHHVHTKPYRDARGNLAGTISAAALVVLGSINLVRAGFEAAEYTPSGPNAFLMLVFSEVENALLLWGPMCVLVLIGLVFLFRISSVLFRCLCATNKPHTASAHLRCDHTRQEHDRNLIT